MKRTARRVARIFLGIVSLMVAVPVVLTGRVVRQERLNQALIEAAKRSDVRAAIRLLEQGADPNCRENVAATTFSWQMLLDELLRRRPPKPSEVMTPLLYSVIWSKEKPNAPSDADFDITWLRTQAENGRAIPGNAALVRAMLEHGADVNTILVGAGGQHSTPLFLAILAGRSDIVHVLLAHGARVEYDDDGELPFTAYTQSDASVIGDLMEHGVVKGWDSLWSTAIINGNVPVVKSMLAHRGRLEYLYGAKWSNLLQGAYRGVQNDSPVMPSASRGEILRLLKAAGAKR